MGGSRRLVERHARPKSVTQMVLPGVSTGGWGLDVRGDDPCLWACRGDVGHCMPIAPRMPVSDCFAPGLRATPIVPLPRTRRRTTRDATRSEPGGPRSDPGPGTARVTGWCGSVADPAVPSRNRDRRAPSNLTRSKATGDAERPGFPYSHH